LGIEHAALHHLHVSPVRVIIFLGSLLGAMMMFGVAWLLGVSLSPLAPLFVLLGIDQVIDMVAAVRGYESRAVAIASTVPEAVVGPAALWIMSYVAIPYYMETHNALYLLLAAAMALVFVSSVFEIAYVIRRYVIGGRHVALQLQAPY